MGPSTKDLNGHGIDSLHGNERARLNGLFGVTRAFFHATNHIIHRPITALFALSLTMTGDRETGRNEERPK